MKLPFVLLKTLLILICFNQSAIAQELEKRTIQVTGSSVYNLSPNEIIIQISFSEYFTDKEESKENKVKLEGLEEKVRNGLQQANVPNNKITEGNTTMYRPRINNNKYLKRRLQKSLYICVKNVEEYVKIIRTFEDLDLFDNIVTTLSVTQYKHTETDAYLTKSRSKAYQNAVEKAKLILSESGESLGRVLKVTETPAARSGSFNADTYEFDNGPAAPISGFKAIVVSYSLNVIFEIE